MKRGWPLALAYAALAIAIFAARPAVVSGPFMRDFEAYWSAGTTVNEGRDPYSRAIWNAERLVPDVDSRHDELLPFIDPPPALALFSLFARLPYRLASGLWIVLLGFGLATLVLVTLRGAATSLQLSSAAAAFALAIACGPITSDLALGQLALLAFLGALLLVLCARRSLPGAIAAAALAFMQPNVALGLASQIGRNRATLAIALGALATYAMGIPFGGATWPIAFLAAVLAHGTAERFTAIQLTPAAIAYGFGIAPLLAELVALGCAGAAIAAAAALAFRVRDGFARFAAWSALVPFVAGFAHEHDLVVAYPAALWCALRTSSAARGVALAGTLLLCIDWLGLAQRPTGLLQSGLLALAAWSAFVALGGPAQKRAAFGIAIPMAVFFGVAAWLAVRHPAPVWPSTLGDFHAQPDASAAQVWLAEQRASGLLNRVPTWAALRALSLLGCALLAYAIATTRTSEEAPTYLHSASDRRG